MVKSGGHSGGCTTFMHSGSAQLGSDSLQVCTCMCVCGLWECGSCDWRGQRKQGALLVGLCFIFSPHWGNDEEIRWKELMKGWIVPQPIRRSQKHQLTVAGWTVCPDQPQPSLLTKRQHGNSQHRWQESTSILSCFLRKSPFSPLRHWNVHVQQQRVSASDPPQAVWQTPSPTGWLKPVCV